MPSPNWARITIALAALATAGVLVATGGKLDTTLARAVSTGSTIVILMLLAFDRWIWRWPVVRKLHGRPVLRGTWRTTLRTTFTERKSEAVESYLVICQTYSEASVRMLFDRSQSESISCELATENGQCKLYYLFRSEKHATEPTTNPANRGAAQLTVAKKPRLHLEGDYWMEIGTKGRVASTGYDKTLYETFSGARQGSYK
jgi:SMODS-associating 2TM, beta-strand rich effector domain